MKVLHRREILIVNSVQLQLCQPKHKLTDEEIRPYLNVSYNDDIIIAFYFVINK